MRWLPLAIVLVAGCDAASSPSEFARERGAIEMLTSWPCRSGKTLGALTGGDLKTDWSASAIPASSDYVVVLHHEGVVATWHLQTIKHSATPFDAAANSLWKRCQPN